MTINVEHNHKKWKVVTNDSTTYAGNEWGWIDGPKKYVFWSDDPGSVSTKAQAAELVKKHNEWLAKQTPASVRLFKAKERMSELSLESAIASAKASNLQERLREAEAEVAALEKELEMETSSASNRQTKGR